MSNHGSFLESLRSAGIAPTDSEDIRLQKSLLMFATGLVSAASMLWLLLYWQLGPQFSATIPFAYQCLLAGNMAVYLRTGDFVTFRNIQLGLFLFGPFFAQWAIGNFVTASGLSLWGVLAPIGAILFIGVRESAAWFFAYVFLMLLSGFFDWYLADTLSHGQPKVPLQTTIFFFGLNFAAVSTIVYLLLRFSIQERQKAQTHLQEAHAMLKREQERSERLLLNILPGPIAQRLKDNNQTIADGFGDVTVMFADIVNFTKVAGGLAPQQVFAMLNRIFSSFDELAEKHGLEKIKTIGDAYMVAGGLNTAQDRYSEAIANMALDMIEVLSTDFAVNAQHLEVRIGIGTGPVVAGVVGKKKFIYDLWGDTVNIASRITGEAAPNAIHLDETTFKRLRHLFDFDEPQTIYFKGKGQMTVHRLLKRKATTLAA